MQSLSWGNLCPDRSMVPDTWLDMDMDDSLTSLEWLHVAGSIPGAILHHQPPPIFSCNQPLASPERPLSPQAGDLASMDTPPIPSKPIATTCSRIQNKIVPGMVAQGTVNYRTNSVKPPYSCATLICMAMQDSDEDKVPVSYLYDWISGNFAYFHHADQTWKNTVRHTLSTQKGFIKVLRQNGEPSKKGGYWRVDPQYAESLLTRTLIHSTQPSVRIHSALHTPLQAGSPPTARSPCNPTGSQTSPCNPTGSQTSPCTSLESQQHAEGTSVDQNRDPRLPEGTTLGSCPQGMVVCGQKRKRSPETGTSPAKVQRCSSSPLLSAERDEQEPPPGDFDAGAFFWDAFLKPACSGEFSPESREQLTTVPTGEDQTVPTQSVSSDVIKPCADWMDPFVETMTGFGTDRNNIQTHAENMLDMGYPMQMESMFLPSDNSMLQLLFMDL